MPKSIGSAAPGLKTCKRYITTHDSTGKSVFAEAPEEVYTTVPGFGGLARSYALDSFPANLTNNADFQAYAAEKGPASFKRRSIVINPGVVMHLVDHEPGGTPSPMHRTVSIDFVVCTISELECELDSGEKVRLFPGDHLIQRGTMHRWSNPSKDNPARSIALTLPCLPFEVNGKPLEEVHLPIHQDEKPNAAKL